MDSLPNACCDLLLILAHPDDETFMGGGTITQATAQGRRGALLCYTDGQAGRLGPTGGPPLATRVEVGGVRRAELLAAAAELSFAEVITPGWRDGTLTVMPALAGVALAVLAIRRLRPRVLISFGSEGGPNRHTDHIATSRWATLARQAAADPAWPAMAAARLQELMLELPAEDAPPAELAAGWVAAQQAAGWAPHAVAAHYWVTWPPEADALRGTSGLPTTHRVPLGTAAQAAKLRAFDAHRTQVDHREAFVEFLRHCAGCEYFHRADVPATQGAGTTPASDLFAGLE